MSAAIIQGLIGLLIFWSSFQTQPGPVMVYVILMWPITYVLLKNFHSKVDKFGRKVIIYFTII